MSYKHLILFFGLAGLMWVAACSKKSDYASDPRETMRLYIEKSFAIQRVEDRASLEEFLTGDARTRLAAWSPSQFQEAFLKSKKKFSKLAFADFKAVSKEEAHLTYDLVFDESVNGVDTRVTNKKACQLVLKESRWYIRECKNIKQLVEYRNGLSIP